MKSLFTSLFILIITASLFAQGLELKPYGFIKGDAVYSSQGVNSFGNPNLSSPQIANGVDEAATGFTAKHTRFGLNASVGDEIKAGGVLELDFFNALGFDSNINPRIRLAYASVAWQNFELRFGQQWDIFSPLNGITNNTNGNLWFAGNLGFRRAQIQVLYKMPLTDIQPMIQLSLGEACKETDLGLGADNKSCLPMVQGRLSAKILENKIIGFYFVYAKYSPVADTSDFDFNTTGFGADFTLPLHKYFEFHGEVSMGTNLNNSDLFTIAGKGNHVIDRKNLSAWANINSKISDHFQLVIGGGMDKNQTDNLDDGTIEQNFIIYGDLIFPVVSGFSIALELGNITTSIKGDEDRTALVAILSSKFSF